MLSGQKPKAVLTDKKIRFGEHRVLCGSKPEAVLTDKKIGFGEHRAPCGQKPKAVLTDKLDSGPLVGSLLILDCKNAPKWIFLVPAKVSPFRNPWIQIGFWTLGRFLINFRLQKCSENDFFNPG